MAGAFENVVHDDVLEPLRMTKTGFRYEPGLPAVTGNHFRYSPARFLLPKWVLGSSAGRWTTFQQFLVDGAPYGGLIGTAEDAARLLQMHLRGGELDGTRIISEPAATEMRQVTARGKRYDLGLGWFTPATQRRARPAFVEHLGGGAGFYNTIRIYPTRGLGIVVMGNSTQYDINAIANVALHLPHGRTFHRAAASSQVPARVNLAKHHRDAQRA